MTTTSLIESFSLLLLCEAGDGGAKGCSCVQANSTWQRSQTMKDKRLLLDLPDIAWASILQLLNSDPATLLDLELVCTRLRSRQQALLSSLYARLQLSYRQQIIALGIEFDKLEQCPPDTALTLLDLSEDGWTSKTPRLGAAAKQSMSQSRTISQSHVRRRDAMVKKFGVSDAQLAELITAVGGYASHIAATHQESLVVSGQVRKVEKSMERARPWG